MINQVKLNKALEFVKNQKYDEAEQLYNELLGENPDDSNLLAFVGLFYINTGNYVNAVTLLKKACEIKETAGTVSALGFSQYEIGDYISAAQTLKHALELGENPEIYDKLTLSLFKSKNYPEAVEYAALMYSKYPDNVMAISNMVKAYTHSGKLSEAENLCVESLKKHPDRANLWLHLGYLKELIYSDDRQALECFKAAEELGVPEANYNIATSYQKLCDYENAEKYYKKMLEICPNSNETLVSYGMCLLKQKKFKEGYKFFYQRKKSQFDSMSNAWKYGDNFEKEITVLCDQGYGDIIQFARYLLFLRQKVEKINIVVRQELVRLFKRNFPEIKIIEPEDLDSSSQTIRITDLAYALDMDFDHIPASEGYLSADTAEIKSDKPKVGLCWEAGSAGIRNMLNRTINVKEFIPIFNLENIQTYSFQYQDTFNGNKTYPQMINLAKDFKDFEDTAKALKAMDLIITVDTAIAHLAGALGVKTWLLLPYSSDWRWFDDTKTTPWYKSVEIFFQKDPRNWITEIDEVVCKIKEYFS